MAQGQQAEEATGEGVEFMDLRGLSTYASLAVPTLRDYLKEGGLPYYRLRGKILVRRSDFDAWIEHYKVDQRDNLEALVEDALSSVKH